MTKFWKRRQMEADSMQEEKIWTKGAKGNEAERETARERTQQGESPGWSVTRVRPHLFSASLPIWTIHQRREQGKINKNSPAGTTTHRTIASLTDKSPQPSTSIKKLYSLTSRFLLLLHPPLILSLSHSRIFSFFSPLVFPIHHCRYG